MLLDEAERQALKEKEARRRQKIEGLVEKINALLVEQDCVWGEWVEVVQQYEKMGDVVFPNTTIKEFLEKYARR